MRTLAGLLLVSGFLFAASFAAAQPPPGGKDGPPKSTDAEAFMARMMAFDKNKDGKLTRDEITDERLLRLFDRADANKDGVVTREELLALYAREAPAASGPPGFGPPGEGGFGPGPGGFGGPPRPGQLLPPFVEDRLNLTEDQKKQVADLQKEVDARLDKILTAEQKTALKEMRQRGRGGFGRGPGDGGPPPGEGRRP